MNVPAPVQRDEGELEAANMNSDTIPTWNEQPVAQTVLSGGKGDWGENDSPRTTKPPNNALVDSVQLIGVFAIWANTWGIVNAFGEFQTYYETRLAQTPSQLAWVGSIQSFLLMLGGLISGPLMDLGYFRFLVLFGNFMVVFGMMMISICKEYWQVIIAQGVVVGIGMGAMFTPGVSIIPQYFTKRRQWASGIAAVGSGLGGVMYPIILHRLVPSIGFSWAVRVLAFVSLFFGIVSIATLRNKLSPKKDRQLSFTKFLHDKSLVLYASGLFIVLIALYIPAVYISSYSLQNHITGPNFAFYLVPTLQASNILGRLVPTFFADSVGPINMTIPAICMMSLLSFVWIIIHTEAGLIAFAVLYGVFFGIVQALGPACVTTLAKESDSLASVTGIAFGIASFGILIGTPVAGAILGAGSSFVGLQAFTGGIAALAAVLYVLCRITKVGMGFAKV